MAYDPAQMGGSIYFGSKSGQKMWFYTTTDGVTPGGFRDAGYFSDAGLRGMQLGDVIFVNEVDDLDNPTTSNVNPNHISAIVDGAGTVIELGAN